MLAWWCTEVDACGVLGWGGSEEFQSERRKYGNRFTIGTGNGSGHPPIRKPQTRGHPEGGVGGVEWRDVRCYATEDASLVVHRSHSDRSVYNLAHAPTGLVILTEATESPDPLIELANRLSRMTDWATLGAAEGINELSPRVRRRIIAAVDRFSHDIRLRAAADGAAADGA